MLPAFGWEDRQATARSQRSFAPNQTGMSQKLYFPLESASFQRLGQILFKVAVVPGERHRIEQSLAHTALVSRKADTEVFRHFGMRIEFAFARVTCLSTLS